MVSFASRYRMPTSIRKDRPLTNEELQRIVPSAFSDEKHDSRSQRYTYIPTIVILDRLRDEGFLPYFATQSRTRDQDKRDFTKHMLRLRRHDQINGKEVPEIILLNSHDGSSSYKMIPGMFRQVCSNGLLRGRILVKFVCRIKAILSGRLSKALILFWKHLTRLMKISI